CVRHQRDYDGYYAMDYW
nr:immunoglobulin heavy chain junction region [Mus musculus]MBK4196295.1 immunoglobulin heavy chain junction region [Mus musculus]